ncbi:MAG: sigma-54 dependent transcriptional regulator [bacterium]|nr:sigma-54 dependent transcriptional regulator [bacterium]MDD4557846.1 sigma-54 dependent transcriptional regulator [bacterium]
MAKQQQSKVLIVDDEPNIRHILGAILRKDGYTVQSADNGEAALKLLEEEAFDLIITDLVMPQMGGIDLLHEIQQRRPGTAVVIMTAYGTIKTAVEAMKIGARDYITKPFEMDEVKIVARNALNMAGLVKENRILKQELGRRCACDEMIGDSRTMAEITDMIEKVAGSRATVLIRGESGTGKELVARAIHRNSRRSDNPFIAVNCAALSNDLLESELFGHEKGAFTGAMAQKPGRFELADGGTLFLDEVGEISPALQVKLLRILQEREFERVGGTKTIKVDIRLIAATNRDLEEAVKKNDFREDLYYRLKVIEMHTPPLRERIEDIPMLAEHFLRRFSQENGKKLREISSEATDLCQGYNWPGNIRELENAMEYAVIMADERCEELTPEMLPLNIQLTFNHKENEVKA